MLREKERCFVFVHFSGINSNYYFSFFLFFSGEAGGEWERNFIWRQTVVDSLAFRPAIDDTVNF